ncbi:hypothetical protein [Flagellimonas sp. SN16]|uniref:hypothetical protein n=1 Tax=Flagellimonas sp. SN16 TaxID=3415142 RepID=UPI003C4AE2DF
MNTEQINKSLEKLKDYGSTQTIKKELRILERENLLKNAYLIDLQRKRRHCYDKSGNIDLKGVKGFLSYLEVNIDGVNQGIGELYDISSTVDIVCEHLDSLQLI